MTNPVSGGVPPDSKVVKVWYDSKGRERLTIQHTKEHTVKIETPEESGVSGGVPEPAECELEAIAALFTSALMKIGNWQDRARYLFDRGVRIRDEAALERPRPAPGPAFDVPTFEGLLLAVENVVGQRKSGAISKIALDALEEGLAMWRKYGAALPPQTGNQAPSEALTRSRIDHWLRNRGLRFEAYSTGDTIEALMALMDDLADYARGNL